MAKNKNNLETSVNINDDQYKDKLEISRTKSLASMAHSLFFFALLTFVNLCLTLVSIIISLCSFFS